MIESATLYGRFGNEWGKDIIHIDARHLGSCVHVGFFRSPSRRDGLAQAILTLGQLYAFERSLIICGVSARKLLDNGSEHVLRGQPGDDELV